MTIEHYKSNLNDLDAEIKIKQAIIQNLKNDMVENAKKYLSEKEIIKGKKVIYDNSEIGIYEDVLYNYGVKPIIKKIKKDGTAHCSQGLYVYDVTKIELYEDGK